MYRAIPGEHPQAEPPAVLLRADGTVGVLRVKQLLELRVLQEPRVDLGEDGEEGLTTWWCWW